MTDRFDEAKRALENVPAPDLWAEAERRAEDGTVVPLAATAARRMPRPGRWLAGAAAVVVLAIGAVAVFGGDDSPLRTGPSSSNGGGLDSEAEVTTYRADGACKLGIAGDPLPEPATVSPAETFRVEDDGQAAVGTLVEGLLNDSQTYAVQVPGEVVDDLLGERVEDVEIARGTASLWFRGQSSTPAGADVAVLNAVQLRWFTGSQEVCESFTVTVSGGTEDENRHAAVDLAERVLMPSEVAELPTADPEPVGNPLADTMWQLESATVDGQPTDGSGALFSFTDRSVSWRDGCNYWSAAYTYYDEILRLDAIDGTDASCEANPTSDTVNAVMAVGGIAAFFDEGRLVLRTLDGELVLRPMKTTTSTVPSSTTSTVP